MFHNVIYKNIPQILPKTFVKICPYISYKYITKNPPVKVGSSSRKWVFSSVCPRPDSNRHGLFSQRILSPSCLPIPSPGQLLFNSRTKPADPSPQLSVGRRLEASAGFEPANGGFANRSLRPLGYDALLPLL